MLRFHRLLVPALGLAFIASTGSLAEASSLRPASASSRLAAASHVHTVAKKKKHHKKHKKHKKHTHKTASTGAIKSHHRVA